MICISYSRNILGGRKFHILTFTFFKTVYVYEILITPDIILFKKIILAFEYKKNLLHISIQNTNFKIYYDMMITYFI
jgi:hypothetical protein